MTYRLAGSLEKLRDQVNSLYPKRNKKSDGWIGDPNHQAEGSGSDHNPNRAGVVCAIDITHDPENGVDIDKLSDQLAATRDPRIKYLIANSLILVPADYGDWDWHPYSGSNPHTSHLHISVYGDYDNKAEWKIKGEGDNMSDVMKREEVEKLLTIGLHPGKDGLNQKQVEFYIGKPSSQLIDDILYGADWPKLNDIILRAYPEVHTENEEHKKLLAQKDSVEAMKKLEEIKKVLGIK